MLCLTWLVLSAAASQAPGATPPAAAGPAGPARALELPPIPLARLLDKLEPRQAARAVAPELGAAGVAPGLEPGALEQPAGWAAWRGALTATLDGARPEASARLALTALEQGRMRDAWRHLELAAADPALAAALLPRFLPGVARGTALDTGGFPAALPDGVVLRPALPPPLSAPTPGDAQRPERRAMRVSGLAIGAAVVELKVAVELEGVQIEVAHLSGGAARVALVLPRAEEFATATEYVDWYKQETVGAPLTIELEPGAEPHVLFARFEPKDLRWPTRLPEELPRALAEHGLVLLAADEAGERERLGALARELSIPALGIAARCETAGARTGGGLVVDLSVAATRADKFAWLVSAIERYASERAIRR